MKKFKNDPNVYFDYRDTKTLQRYIDSYGSIEPISKTGLSAYQACTSSSTFAICIK